MDRALSLSDHAVLAALGEGPAHGFRLAALFAKEGELGGVWAVGRPQVYRALGRLEGLGYARVAEQVAGGGPPRSVYALTRAGEAALRAWLKTPVLHLRDARSELLLKLIFLERAGHDPKPLIDAQTGHFGRVRDGYRARLEAAAGAERLALEWRLAAVEAALKFLAEHAT